MGFETTPFVLPPFAFEAAVAPEPEPIPDAPGEVGMSLAAVRLRLAAIIIGANPVGTPRGMSASFHHVTEAGDRDLPPRARAFFIASDEFSTMGPYTPLGSSNERKDRLRIEITYPDDLEDAEIDNAMSNDYDAISARLLNDALWNRPDSTIISLTVDGDRFIPARILRARGQRRMSIPLTVEHTR